MGMCIYEANFASMRGDGKVMPFPARASVSFGGSLLRLETQPG